MHLKMSAERVARLTTRAKWTSHRGNGWKGRVYTTSGISGSTCTSSHPIGREQQFKFHTPKGRSMKEAGALLSYRPWKLLRVNAIYHSNAPSSCSFHLFLATILSACHCLTFPFLSCTSNRGASEWLSCAAVMIRGRLATLPTQKGGYLWVLGKLRFGKLYRNID